MSRERSYDPVEVGGGDAERERGGTEAGAFVVGFVGLELRDTKLVTFDSPQAGTPVMQAAPLAPLDLPLKVVVSLHEYHQTKVSYTATGTVAVRYLLSEELASRLAGIDAVTDAVIDR